MFPLRMFSKDICLHSYAKKSSVAEATSRMFVSLLKQLHEQSYFNCQPVLLCEADRMVFHSSLGVFHSSLDVFPDVFPTYMLGMHVCVHVFTLTPRGRLFYNTPMTYSDMYMTYRQRKEEEGGASFFFVVEWNPPCLGDFQFFNGSPKSMQKSLNSFLVRICIS